LGFLPVFVRQVLRGETIRLFGDGQQIRDCLHVNDVSAALALAALTPQAAGSVFNLGHPDPMSLRDIASTMVALRPGSRVETQPWPSELARIDIGSFSGDFSKAKLVLGWAPRVSLAEGMADTLSFYGARPWYLSSI
jgi:nucleoside-diphosphate-sugar epimerase